MKTAVLLSAASLATAFVIPGNDQQLLSAFTTDDATAVQQLPSEEQAPQGGDQHRKHHGHHDDGNEEKVNEIFSGDHEHDLEHERIPYKWHHAAGLAKGLEKFVEHFEEMEQFGPPGMLEEGGDGKKGKYGKKGKGCMKGKKHREEHFEDEEFHAGEKKHHGKHHEDEEHSEGKHHGKHHEDDEDEERFEGKHHGKHHEDHEDEEHFEGKHEVKEMDQGDEEHHEGEKKHHGKHHEDEEKFEGKRKGKKHGDKYEAKEKHHGKHHEDEEHFEGKQEGRKHGDKYEAKEKHHGKHHEDDEHFEAKHHGKHHEDEERFEGKHHGKHHGDEERFEGERFEGEHFEGEHHELDVFDFKAFRSCAHGKAGRQPGFFNKVMGGLKHAFGFSPFDSDSEGPIDHSPHPPHHHETNKTIYELISGSNHTTVFTSLINQYDDVVGFLNSTQANYTIFVPVDEAFESVHHHNFSKEAIFNYLEYHISPEVFTLHDFFDVQTVPTLRAEETESKYPQRISTSLSSKGLTLNFHSHVVRPDIHATNGIIHAIDKLLIPALSAQSTIELVPSVFSTLNLALIKTGLIDVDAEDLKAGGTFLAPTNQAFAKLPTKVNAFLFSHAGEKYLKALLKYHIVPGHTLFTDAYYDDGEDSEAIANDHYDLPTLLDDKSVSIDIRQFHRLTLVTVNKHTAVSVANVPVKEGVIHLLSSVLIPPHPKPDTEAEAEEGEGREHEHEQEHEHPHKHELSVHSLMERLEPFLE